MEIPPDSNDADLRSEDREFAASDTLDFLEKANLDGNLLTTAENASKKEMLIERGLLNNFLFLLIISIPAIFPN